MNFHDYATATGETAIYPGAGTGRTSVLAYVCLGLVGESSEVKEKELVGDTDGLFLELGDVAWYLARAHVELGLNLDVDITPAGTVDPFSVDELTVAAGRVAETVKKVIRDDASTITAERRTALTGALDQTLAAWVAIHASYGLDPAAVLAANCAKLASRRSRGVLAGDGDTR